MSDTSSVSSSSVSDKARVYKCGACNGLGHNKRTCPTITKVKVVREPKPVEMQPAPVPPSPPPLPPSPPASVAAPEKLISSALDRVFTARKEYFAPIFGLLRSEYTRTPGAFTIEQVPHTSASDGRSHLTIKHSHPFDIVHPDGKEQTINAYTYYHLVIEPFVSKSGHTKQRYIELTTIDAYRRPFTVCKYC